MIVNGTTFCSLAISLVWIIPDEFSFQKISGVFVVELFKVHAES